MHALRRPPLLLPRRLLPQAAALHRMPAVAVHVRQLLPQAAALHPGSLPAKLPRRLLPKTISATVLARDWDLLPLSPYRRWFLPVEKPIDGNAKEITELLGEAYQDSSHSITRSQKTRLTRVRDLAGAGPGGGATSARDLLMKLRCRGKLFSWPYRAAKKSFSFFPLKNSSTLSDPKKSKKSSPSLLALPVSRTSTECWLSRSFPSATSDRSRSA